MEATCEILYKLVGLWNRHTCLHKGHFLFEICLYNSLAQLLQYPPYHFDLERSSTYMATRKQHSVLQHERQPLFPTAKFVIQMMHNSSSSLSVLSAFSSCPTSLTSSMIQTLDGSGAKISISFLIKYWGKSNTISFHCLPPISRSYRIESGNVAKSYCDLVKNIFGCFGSNLDPYNEQRKHETTESEARYGCHVENLRTGILGVRNGEIGEKRTKFWVVKASHQAISRQSEMKTKQRRMRKRKRRANTSMTRAVMDRLTSPKWLFHNRLN